MIDWAATMQGVDGIDDVCAVFQYPHFISRMAEFLFWYCIVSILVVKGIEQALCENATSL